MNIKLVKTQNTILSAALILAVSSGVNAILGFVKARLLAHYFGISNELAIFYTSDRIPNLVYSVLIVGAVSTVFIPVFTSALKKDESKALRIASSIINITFLFFLVVGSILFALAPEVIKLLSINKFSLEEIKLGANLMRIMLASQLLLVAGSLITSVLQSFKHFIMPALAPVAYSLGMILGIVFLSSKFGIYGPAIGVLIGSVFHFSIQLPVLIKSGFSYSLSLNLGDKSLRKTLTLIPPRILSVLLANTVQTINNSLAILVSTSSVVFLKFATQLQTFPISLIGASIATASLPTLSGQDDEKDLSTFKKTFLTSFHQMMFLILPLSMILFIMRVPVVRIVYGVSNFPWGATLMTAYTLCFFSISIFAQSGNYLMTRAFFALKDTFTPVFVSIGTAIINVLLSIYFITVLEWEVWAVALSFSITSFIDFILFMYLLNKKVHGFGLKNVAVPFMKISLATILMGITLYAPIKLLDIRVLDTSRVINLLLLMGIAGITGITTYLGFTKLLKVEEIELFYKLMRKLKLNKPKPLPQPPLPEHTL